MPPPVQIAKLKISCVKMSKTAFLSIGRVDSEKKNGNLKFDFFGLAHSLTIYREYNYNLCFNHQIEAQ